MFALSIFAHTVSVFAKPVIEVEESIEIQEEPEEEFRVEEEIVEDPEKDIPSSVVYMGENGNTIANILIKSYNPGFSDLYVGEFFELTKLPKSSISLAGLSIIYETSAGNEYVVYEFSEGHEMVGESLLMRLASSKEVDAAENASLVADVTYTRNMSQSAGRLKLKYEDETIDAVCWGLKETGCYGAFSSKKPSTLVRIIDDEEIGDFAHKEDYAPKFDVENPGLHFNEPEEEAILPRCREMEFSELFSYYENTSTEQFIELFNRGEETVDLAGCLLRYKNNYYALDKTVIGHGFIVFYPAIEWQITLTKNPVSSNRIELVDADGEIVDSLVYYSGQKRGLSLSMFGYRSDGSRKWEQTYKLTPGSENSYQQFKTCPVGKVINLETGNCVNESPIETTLAACPEGKYRNPLTGRCKSYATTATAELKPCAEGYERNPETNRCRKIIANTGADYPVATGTYEDKKEFISIWAIATIIAAGVGYIIFQYKDELKQKLIQR